MKIEKPFRFISAFYIIALAGVLLFNIFSLCYDSIGRAAGSVVTEDYSFEELDTNEQVSVQDEHNATSEGEDPQLLIENLQARPVEVRFNITFSQFPGEVTLYYKKAGEDYSNTKKIYGKAQPDGTYVFTLPSFEKIDDIRIDPTNIPHVTMQLNSFTLNAPRSVLSYFALSYSDIFNLIVYPGLAAAVAGWFITAFGEKISIKKKVNKNG